MGFAKRKYYVDESFFEKIDSPIKAQILGMIYADGCIIHNEVKKNYVFCISLKEDDKKYIEFIKEEIKYEGPLHYKLKTGNRQNQWMLSICSKKIYYDLVNIGLTPRKSLTVEFPNFNQVQETFLPNFILGYFEGDGCIYIQQRKDRPNCIKSEIIICGTKKFLSFIRNYIQDKFNIYSAIKQHGKIDILTISGIENSYNFLNWLYSGHKEKFNFIMERKYNKFLQLKNYYEKTEERHVEKIKILKERMKIVSKNNYVEKWLQNKEGTIYHVKGLKPFGEEYNLSEIGLNSLFSDKSYGRDRYKGWRRYNYDQNNPPENYIEKFY